MNQREKALWCLSSAQFVLWELHLYLDTHPDDKETLKQYNKCAENVKTMRSDFETRFGALSPGAASGREWIKNPWPWDYSGEVC